jgi:hypothetical protein
MENRGGEKELGGWEEKNSYKLQQIKRRAKTKLTNSHQNKTTPL